MATATVLASDIDNTLTGDAGALETLRLSLDALRASGRLVLVLSTGRRIDQVVDGQAHEGLPEADAVVGQVGTEVYLPPFSRDQRPLEDWTRELAVGFDRTTVEALLDGIAGLRLQEEADNTALKVSFYVEGSPAPDAVVDRVRRRIRDAGFAWQVVWSSQRHLDVLPQAAGKGRAIRFVLATLRLPPETVIVAGDSGNDATMFDAFERGIVVANAQPELLSHARLRPGGSVYLARESYAAGVAEGLRHYGVLDGTARQEEE